MGEEEPVLFPRLRRRIKEFLGDRREEKQVWFPKTKKRLEEYRGETPKKDITDLVRSQFQFTCPICEEIAEEVSGQFPDKVTKMKVYEAVYKLSSGDNQAQEEAMVTLGKLGVMEQVVAMVEEGWEKLKGEKPD